MFAYSVWINKLFDTLGMGYVVGIRETIDDYDHETDKYVTIVTNDRQFRVRSGGVYCKGGSVMFPKPLTDADGWEFEPIANPYYFFDDLLDNGCVQDVYIYRDDKASVPIWNNQTGWLSRREIIKRAVPALFGKCVDVECEGKYEQSLKVLSGLVALEVVGPLYLKMMEYCFDYETREKLLKPKVWWIEL
jgi:hypothetical protein